MLPVIAYNLLQSIALLSAASEVFATMLEKAQQLKQVQFV